MQDAPRMDPHPIAQPKEPVISKPDGLEWRHPEYARLIRERRAERARRDQERYAAQEKWRGMRCYACGCMSSEVVKTLPRAGHVIRVRRCLGCRRQFRTTELDGERAKP